MPYSHQSQLGLKQLLARSGLLNDEQLEDAYTQTQKKQTSLISVLVDDFNLDATALAQHLSSELGLPLFDIAEFDIDSVPEEAFKESLVKKHTALPLYIRGKILYVALSDPTNYAALEDFAFSTGMQTEAVCAEHPKLLDAINKAFESVEDSLEISDLDSEEFSDLEVEDTEKRDEEESAEKDDAPIVVYINKLLLDAIRRGASDLHFEPYEHSYRVRFRIDGILHEIASPPVALASRMAARLKVMSKLDIAEKRVPQDGRIKLKLSKKKAIDFRVSTLPTLWGEKVVMRILDSSSAMMGIDALGYDADQKQLYLGALNQPQGMILVTGPTGSGKTVSLYTGLNILNRAELNISTAEDPVEINLPGINQVQINMRAGLDFASALRAFLRQDPDIVMVGEIRDLETAEIAIKAAQTGHLVMSTLHTNSAPETLTRLVNMGVPSYNIASSINLVIAQRLARRLCSHCKQEETLPSEEALKQGFNQTQIDKGIHLFKPVGCDQCTEGYKGRVGIYEVMPITPPIAKIIMEGGNSLDIAEQALQEGINDLRRSGLEKALQGVTSLSEVNRVTHG